MSARRSRTEPSDGPGPNSHKRGASARSRTVQIRRERPVFRKVHYPAPKGLQNASSSTAAKPQSADPSVFLAPALAMHNPCAMGNVASFNVGSFDAPLTLAYSRPAGNFTVQDAEMDLLSKRYRHRLRFERWSPLGARRRYRVWTSSQQPMLLLVRGNEVLYAEIGRLPTRELKTAVDQALRDEPQWAAKCG